MKKKRAMQSSDLLEEIGEVFDVSFGQDREVSKLFDNLFGEEKEGSKL